MMIDDVIMITAFALAAGISPASIYGSRKKKKKPFLRLHVL